MKTTESHCHCYIASYSSSEASEVWSHTVRRKMRSKPLKLDQKLLAQSHLEDQVGHRPVWQRHTGLL